MRKRVMAMAVLLLCMVGILAGAGNGVVYADTKPEEKVFSGDVKLLKQENSNYVMQVTVGNTGEDFSGTVKVVFANTERDNCAYNTELSLPSQGEKQFTLTIPQRAADAVRGLCAVNFLDDRGKLVETISLKNVFGDTVSGIPVGVLSEKYTDLTFMDLGGQDFYVNNMAYPIDLIELDEDNLSGYLDGLYFMIIDAYDTSALSEETIQAIQDWVKDGGWLLIGTGAYAEQTLSGFDEDFLNVSLTGICEPGEESSVSINRKNYGNYWNYQDSGIDFTNMTIAELGMANFTGYESSENPALCAAVGDGAVSVFNFSLTDPELAKASTYTCQYMYEETMYNSMSYQNNFGGSNMEYVGQRALALIDSNNTDVDFKFLKILMVVYVVLVGPILYLILRKCKKSEWYWIGAPVLGILFIAGVFVFGQNVKVNETKVYSVTASKEGSSQANTYYLAYHSGVGEWKMRLNEQYQVAGPGWCDYYGGNGNNAGDYHYAVTKDNEGLSIGMKPQENFESGFLYAQGTCESKGTITGSDIKGSGLTGTISGSVTNDSVRDMKYMAVWFDSYLMVFSDVKAGETLNLSEAKADSRCVYQGAVSMYDSLLYDMVSMYSNPANLSYEQDDMAALLIGIGIADDEKPEGTGYATVVGLYDNYDKTVADKCNETSYGCLYSYEEMEVENNAAD